MIRRAALSSAILLMVAVAAAQDDPLREALLAQRHALSLDAEGELRGPGAELLRAAAIEAEFVLVGEDHGIAEIPALVAALLGELRPAGFDALAIEIGAETAAALEASLREDPEGGAYVEFLREHWPGTAFYTWEQESELLREAVGLDYALWGLDYDILGDRYALRRLRQLAPDESAAAVADEVIAAADTALESALAEQNPGKLMMFGGSEELWPRLREAYANADDDALAIVDLLQETRAINGLFFSGQNYESNRRRALWNKRQFARFLHASGAEAPKVVMKFGANHMMRGRTSTSVFDLGTLAAELAELRGGRSFSMIVLPGEGTQQAQLDPRTMGTIAGDAGVLPYLRPVYDVAAAEGWSLFDLRPLRAQLALLNGLDPQLVDTIYGYDVLVVLGGSTPQRALPLR